MEARALVMYHVTWPAVRNFNFQFPYRFHYWHTLDTSFNLSNGSIYRWKNKYWEILCIVSYIPCTRRPYTRAVSRLTNGAFRRITTQFTADANFFFVTRAASGPLRRTGDLRRGRSKRLFAVCNAPCGLAQRWRAIATADRREEKSTCDGEWYICELSHSF